MTTLRTITTVELSSLCTLKCSYCVNRLLVNHPDRVPGIMAPAIFEATLEVLGECVKRGTQAEVNLNGNGESLMDVELPSRVKRVKDIVGDRKVQLSTNGTLLSYELAAKLKDAGLDRMDLSTHSPAHARKAVYMLAQAGIQGVLTVGQIRQAHNWAGQLEPENTIPCMLSQRCDPLMEGRGYIQSEGDIVPCCYDYRSLGRFAHVMENVADIFNTPIQPFELCDTCHQVIPDEFYERNVA